MNYKRVNYTKEEIDQGMQATETQAGEVPNPPLDQISQNSEQALYSNYELIEMELRRKETTAKLALSLGYAGKNAKGQAEAFKYVASVLQEIKKTETVPGETDRRKLARDLTTCTIDSIVRAIVDAASFRLPIDGRGLAYIVKYNNIASFQPGYKGFIYKISEYYKDVDFTAEPVFEDDEITLSDEGGFQTYRHIKKSPFERNQKKMIGLISCLSYSGDHGRHSKVTAMPKSEIDQIREMAKQDSIWSNWYYEKAKAAALKRLCKIHFATVMGVQELVMYDNSENFVIETPNGDKLTPKNSGNELNKLLEHQSEEVINQNLVAAQSELKEETKL